MSTGRLKLRRLHQHLHAAGEAAPRPADGVATPARAPLLSNGSAATPSATSSKPSSAASGLPPAEERVEAAGEATAGGAVPLKAPAKHGQERHGKRPQPGAPPAAGQEPLLPPAKLPRHGPGWACSPASAAQVGVEGGAELPAEKCAAQAVSAAATPFANLERASCEPTCGPVVASLPASRHRSMELSAAAVAQQQQQPGEQQGRQEQREQGGQHGPGDQLPLDVRGFIAEVFAAAAPAAVPAAEAYLWQEGVRSFAGKLACSGLGGNTARCSKASLLGRC